MDSSTMSTQNTMFLLIVPRLNLRLGGVRSAIRFLPKKNLTQRHPLRQLRRPAAAPPIGAPAHPVAARLPATDTRRGSRPARRLGARPDSGDAPPGPPAPPSAAGS